MVQHFNLCMTTSKTFYGNNQYRYQYLILLLTSLQCQFFKTTFKLTRAINTGTVQVPVLINCTIGIYNL
jgi:hypothetical protein